MGVSEGARQQAKERSRLALLEAGIALISEHGLDGPSLDAICERAGYTRGAFYVHFADRDDFLVAVMEHVGRPIVEQLVATGDPADGLASVASRFIAAFQDGTYPLAPAGSIRPHQLLDACARSERIRSLYLELIADVIARVRVAIEADQEAGRLRADLDPGVLAATLLTLVVGAQTVAELGVPIDLGATARLVLTTLRKPR